jgi:hypothetical protein
MKPVEPFAESRGTLVPLRAGSYDLAIDPGACTGWALFGGAGGFVACGIGEPPFDTAIRRVVIELPQVYPNHPVPPNDLITLAFLAGRYVGTSASAGADAATVFPHEWKGNLPKDVCAARVLARLTPDECAIVDRLKVPKGKLHNVMDAIGIGLFAFRKIRL